MTDGKRTSKNHNLIKDFLKRALELVKPKGYIMFITPDNWMSYADRNTLIETITDLQIIHLDIFISNFFFSFFLI
jgi:tRNA G10  N-methylase Trm11